MTWPSPRAKMGPIRGKLLKRPMQTSRAAARLSSEQEDQRIQSTQKLHTRGAGERRSKSEQDRRLTATEKGKMKGWSTSPVPKKRKLVRVQDVSSSEDMRGRSRETSVEDMEVELRYVNVTFPRSTFAKSYNC